MSTNERDFEERLAAHLRESEAQLQAGPHDRLAIIREEAIKHARFTQQESHAFNSSNVSNPLRSENKCSGLFGNWYWEPVLLVAGLVLIAVMLALPAQSPGVMNPDNNMAIEAGAHEDPEFYESLEFYEWLAEQKQAG